MKYLRVILYIYCCSGLQLSEVMLIQIFTFFPLNNNKPRPTVGPNQYKIKMFHSNTIDKL